MSCRGHQPDLHAGAACQTLLPSSAVPGSGDRACMCRSAWWPSVPWQAPVKCTPEHHCFRQGLLLREGACCAGHLSLLLCLLVGCAGRPGAGGCPRTRMPASRLLSQCKHPRARSATDTGQPCAAPCIAGGLVLPARCFQLLQQRRRQHESAPRLRSRPAAAPGVRRACTTRSSRRRPGCRRATCPAACGGRSRATSRWSGLAIQVCLLLEVERVQSPCLLRPPGLLQQHLQCLSAWASCTHACKQGGDDRPASAPGRSPDLTQRTCGRRHAQGRAAAVPGGWLLT